MLLPKRVKYRRVHRGRLTGKAYRGNKVTYGDFGLQALEPAWITSNQIEAARVAMTRYSLTSDSSSLLTSSKTRCASRRLRRTSLVLKQLSVRMSLAKRTHKGRED